MATQRGEGFANTVVCVALVGFLFCGGTTTRVVFHFLHFSDDEKPIAVPKDLPS